MGRSAPGPTAGTLRWVPEPPPTLGVGGDKLDLPPQQHSKQLRFRIFILGNNSLKWAGRSWKDWQGHLSRQVGLLGRPCGSFLKGEN